MTHRVCCHDLNNAKAKHANFTGYSEPKHGGRLDLRCGAWLYILLDDAMDQTVRIKLHRECYVNAGTMVTAPSKELFQLLEADVAKLGYVHKRPKKTLRRLLFPLSRFRWSGYWTWPAMAQARIFTRAEIFALSWECRSKQLDESNQTNGWWAASRSYLMAGEWSHVSQVYNFEAQLWHDPHIASSVLGRFKCTVEFLSTPRGIMRRWSGFKDFEVWLCFESQFSDR